MDAANHAYHHATHAYRNGRQAADELTGIAGDTWNTMKEAGKNMYDGLTKTRTNSKSYRRSPWHADGAGSFGSTVPKGGPEPRRRDGQGSRRKQSRQKKSGYLRRNSTPRPIDRQQPRTNIMNEPSRRDERSYHSRHPGSGAVGSRPNSHSRTSYRRPSHARSPSKLGSPTITDEEQSVFGYQKPQSVLDFGDDEKTRGEIPLNLTKLEKIIEQDRWVKNLYLKKNECKCGWSIWHEPHCPHHEENKKSKNIAKKIWNLLKDRGTNHMNDRYLRSVLVKKYGWDGSTGVSRRRLTSPVLRRMLQEINEQS